MPDFVLQIKGLPELDAALKRISWASLDLTAPLSVLGDEVLKEFQGSFAKEQSPSGEPWHPLAQKTIDSYVYPRKPAKDVTRAHLRRRRRRSRQVRGSDHILQARAVPGWLLRQLRVDVGRYELTIGEPESKVAERAEEGAEHTPARPFVELTPDMEERALDLLMKHLDVVLE